MSMHYRERALSADDVASFVPSHAKVFVQGACATPEPLLVALGNRTDIENVSLYHLHLAGKASYLKKENTSSLRSVSFFVGPNLRLAVEEGWADFMPVFLSDIPSLFKTKTVPLDVAIVQVSPPDAHGHCTLGTSCDVTRSAVDHAKIVIAEINECMPRTSGATVVSIDRFAAYTWTERPLFEAEPAEISAEDKQIGELVSHLIEDGATLQMGIGSIPDAVLASLSNKIDLGVHSEMFSDGLIPLIANGVVTNKYKHVHPGRTVTSFVSGSKKLFEFVHQNQLVEFHPSDRTNDTALIRKNDKVVAINSALEMDLSGQVCADSMGYKIFSGIGGQMDFIRGAALSRGGKAILALRSTAAKGKLSRIVCSLKQGAGVVTTRGHVHWVCTEYGAVNLHGKTLRERGEALISIAHPDFRSELSRELRSVRHFS